MDALFFWLFSAGMIIGGLAVVLNRNPVASLMSFVASIACMSGLFIMLSAFFLATIELLVTAGAVMVLFLFVIMLLDITTAETMPRQKIWMGCSMVLCLGFLFIVARTLNATPAGSTTMAQAPPAPLLTASATARESAHHPRASADFIADLDDDTHRIGYLLFRSRGHNGTSYVAPFEITSLLILVATVGVIVLCKQDEPRRSPPREEIAREAPPIEPKKSALTR